MLCNSCGVPLHHVILGGSDLYEFNQKEAQSILLQCKPNYRHLHFASHKEAVT